MKTLRIFNYKLALSEEGNVYTSTN